MAATTSGLLLSLFLSSLVAISSARYDVGQQYNNPDKPLDYDHHHHNLDIPQVEIPPNPEQMQYYPKPKQNHGYFDPTESTYHKPTEHKNMPIENGNYVSTQGHQNHGPSYRKSEPQYGHSIQTEPAYNKPTEHEIYVPEEPRYHTSEHGHPEYLSSYQNPEPRYGNFIPKKPGYQKPKYEDTDDHIVAGDVIDKVLGSDDHERKYDVPSEPNYHKKTYYDEENKTHY